MQIADSYPRIQKHFRRQNWFVNSGLLSDISYLKAFEFINDILEDEYFTNSTLYLCVDYLVQYFELVSINSTKLVNSCIKRHLQFVEKLMSQSSHGSQFVASEYWHLIYKVFEKFDNTSDFIERQFCVDALERICCFLTNRTMNWIKSTESLFELKAFGKCVRNCVIYNSFLIPNFAEYTNPLTSPEQKLFDKIENECKCKMMLHETQSDCRYGEANMVLEVLFDWYKGNFLGFLDCLGYIVKVINPRKHFIKSVRTIIKTEDNHFTVLSDLPLKELTQIEKHATTGNLMAPFLSSDALSKQLFNIFAPDVAKETVMLLTNYLVQNEDLEFWKTQLSRVEMRRYRDNVNTFVNDYQNWILLCREWNEFKLEADKRPLLRYSVGSGVDEQAPDVVVNGVKSMESQTLDGKYFDEEEEVVTATNTNGTYDTNDTNDTDALTVSDSTYNSIKQKKPDILSLESDDTHKRPIFNLIKQTTSEFNNHNSSKATLKTPDLKYATIQYKEKPLNSNRNNESIKSKSSSYGSGRRTKKSKGVVEGTFHRPSINIPELPMSAKIVKYLRKFNTDNSESDSNEPQLDERMMQVLEIFEKLYRRYEMYRSDPDSTLNHTLRVILRCDTNYNEGDREIAKLGSQPRTIHELLKKHYNYDLTKGHFFTQLQRQMSYSAKQEKKKQELKKAQYLENRNMVTSFIDKAVRTLSYKEDFSVEAEAETDTKSLSASKKTETIIEEEDKTVQQMLIDDDILFGDWRETQELLTAKFKKEIFEVFGELNQDILQLFNENRINILGVWDAIHKKRDVYLSLIPLPHQQLQCDSAESYIKHINPEQQELIKQSVSHNVYITIKILSKHDPDFETEYPKLLKGQGIQLQFLTDLNKMTSNKPKYISTIHSKHGNLKKDFYSSICFVSFDLYLICGSLFSALGQAFERHKRELLQKQRYLPKPIKELLSLFEFNRRINDAQAMFKVRLKNRTKEEIGILLRLSFDLRRFSELIYGESCCKWHKSRCIRIIYMAMNIDGNKKAQEPFLRKGGDRRLKRIETKCNCLMTMRLITHEQTGVLIPFVEIFYDFFKGNHFCCIDMLRRMFADNRGSVVRLVNMRHLLCMPQGELWLMPDVEWLHTKMSHLIAQEITT